MNKTIDLNKLTLAELEQKIESLEQRKEEVSVQKVGVWEVGNNYVIRTVTMIQVGKLIQVTDNELVLEDCAWVADTGRYSEFLNKGTVNEVEPFPDGKVIVGRHSIVDACKWKFKLLRDVK